MPTESRTDRSFRIDPVDAHAAATLDRTSLWTKPETLAIQKELARLGLYRMTIDGVYGAGSDAGLVEAFGDDRFRTMQAADVLARLQAAQPPAGTKGSHRFRYGELFRDGVLD